MVEHVHSCCGSAGFSNGAQTEGQPGPFGDAKSVCLSADLTQPPPGLIKSIQELVEQLRRPAVSAENELWTAHDIAAYLKLAACTVERRVVVQPGFPTSMQPCATGAKASKRWFAAEVIIWLRQHRARLPLPRRPKQRA